MSKNTLNNFIDVGILINESNDTRTYAYPLSMFKDVQDVLEHLKLIRPKENLKFEEEYITMKFHNVS